MDPDPDGLDPDPDGLDPDPDGVDPDPDGLDPDPDGVDPEPGNRNARVGAAWRPGINRRVFSTAPEVRRRRSSGLYSRPREKFIP